MRSLQASHPLTFSTISTTHIPPGTHGPPPTSLFTSTLLLPCSSTMAQQQEHPIFDDILRGDLEAVQQRVLSEGAVLEERIYGMTPLISAIYRKKPAIALWLIQHRGQHDVSTPDARGWTALHHASDKGLLEVVQALVAAGANPAALTRHGSTPLIWARGHTDIVTFLLQLPAVKASMDHISQNQCTALFLASWNGHQPVVQLLLDAGADPTIPAGPQSPVNEALNNSHHTIAALLRHPIDKAERARALHKARSLLGAGAGATLACLQGRVEQGQALQQLQQQQEKQQQQQQEKLRATAARVRVRVRVTGGGYTPLMIASIHGHTDIVAFLLKQPVVKATIDHIEQYQWTALSWASFNGHHPIVELLLDAGADPTIPAGQDSPLNLALYHNHHAIAALLRHPIDEAERARALHKARSLLGAGAGAAALACLQGRVEQGQALPQLELVTPQQQQEKLQATAAFAVGVSGGEKDSGLCEDLYIKLQEYMLPGAWADKGPAA